jgi:iron complex transport system ATP-binding protein
MRLVASQVSIQYPGARVRALDDVSFAVAGGELVAVVGPNGCGKTTLLRTLLGLERPLTGTVQLDDRDLGTWTRRQLAEVIGALPQREEPAFPLTVREAVLLGRWARLGPTAAITADDESAIAGALARCDVSGFEDRGIETLSGGEWQRVRVARALAAMPRLLLLDEPTAALDVGHEMALFELLRQLVTDGLGVLVITHHLNLAARYADRLVLLDRGRVVADGAPAAVLRADLVSRVFEWPVAVVPWNDQVPQVVPLRRNEV